MLSPGESVYITLELTKRNDNTLLITLAALLKHVIYQDHVYTNTP